MGMTHSSLEAGFALDRLFRWMEAGMEGSKRPTLVAVARILAENGARYALIGGVALQVHRREPRTTLDIDLVLATRGDWPDRVLELAGFRKSGDFEALRELDRARRHARAVHDRSPTSRGHRTRADRGGRRSTSTRPSGSGFVTREAARCRRPSASSFQTAAGPRRRAGAHRGSPRARRRARFLGAPTLGGPGPLTRAAEAPL